MDFKDRLRLIDSLQKSKGVKSNETSDSRKAGLPVRDIQASTFRQYDCLEFSYATDYRQGNTLINNYFNKSLASAELFLKELPATKISLQKTLFLDTETTGLSGGVGTCAFLVGLGFLNQENDNFVLHQYFMNDFDEEYDMLKQISDFAKKFDLLVTYNGKSYDIPLLNSRFIFNGIPSPFSELPHLDVLHSVRRLWNHRLPDCSLLSAEKYIVHKTREGDIPGFMIPYLFFDYLKSKNKEAMQPVFYHNREDILTMVATLNKMIEVIEAPIDKNLDCRSAIRVGRFYEKCGRFDLTIKLYEDFLHTVDDIPFKKELLMQLALAYKKQSQYELAQAIWQEYIDKETFHPLPYIEMAKHYEHRKKDHSTAIKLVATALKEMDIIYTLGRNACWRDYKEDLKHRYSRLKNKTEKQQN